jgi:hypothetical protein
MLGASLFLGAIFFPKRNYLFFKGNILSQNFFLAKKHLPKKKNQNFFFEKSIPQ